MEYLKDFIVDIYYNGGIYSVHLRNFFSYFYLLLAHGKKSMGKKLMEYLKKAYSGYLL